ncbi:MAG: hypothetical protein ACRC3B_11285 [Bacteroidia bacterium]
MKFTILPLLLIGTPLAAQHKNYLFPEWGVTFNANSNAMVYRPANQNPDDKFQSVSFLSPGIGIYAAPWKDDALWVLTNINYETRGSGEIIYIHDIQTNRVNDVDERFHCITGNVQFRYQFPSIRFRPFIGIGIGINSLVKTRNGIIRENQNDDPATFLYPNAVFLRPDNYKRFTAQALASAGITVNNLATLEFSIVHDMQPVLKNDISAAWLWTNTLCLRLNIAELINREQQKKANTGQ